ncbi:hypothetical protein [Mucilaginibacter ginsenosidivorax]|uniref:Uncharacterized protein n=1 Tax=Mucilaginibacter ginsenosidivorax TaxID=862126 RepID=A0A5B8W4K3_9SPHI|nr:hypothetical protein [Mucilaginibacter ginsenosidivorax]QEC78980.1 hypothetical protein FSB76_24645 [Mucilaginibacter ginsenosidivorax]
MVSKIYFKHVPDQPYHPPCPGACYNAGIMHPFIKLNPVTPRAIKSRFDGLLNRPGLAPKSAYDPTAPFYLNATKTVELTEMEFAKSFAIYSDQDGAFYDRQ